MPFVFGLRGALRLLVLVGLLLGVSRVDAYPTYSMGPDLPDSVANSGAGCQKCHVVGGGGSSSSCGGLGMPCLNQFGRNYYYSGWVDSIYNADTDGDGTNNYWEINNSGNASPGWPAGADARQCYMSNAAPLAGYNAWGGWYDCGYSSPVSVNAYHRTDGISSYQFSFGCRAHTTGSGPNCDDINECASNPCYSHGSCSQDQFYAWTSPGYHCSCYSGWSGQNCLNVTNACLAGTYDCVGGYGACTSTGGASFTCSCPAGYTGDGRTSGSGCYNLDACANNRCDDNGDTASTCTDKPPPAGNDASGYTCSCSSSYIYNGSSCVKGCSGPGSTACGNGGTCAQVGGPTSWTCSCPTGYVTTSGSQPSCIDFNACTTTARASCQYTVAGNACVDNAPPSLDYHCTCGAAYVVAMTTDGKSSCIDKDECVPNHCRAGGDETAECADHVAPATGYDCTCSSEFWKLAPVDGKTACVDVDECEGTNPCVNGTCTNITDGGGYACDCDPGYVAMGPAKAPVCYVDYCTTDAKTLCIANAPGNECINNAPPATGYTCACGNPAYAVSKDGQRCTNRNDCTSDPCSAGGNSKAECEDNPPPQVGYTCDCGVGWVFDGTTCVDVDECRTSNPCGDGICTNAIGGYTCACKSGKSTGGLQPKCDGAGAYTTTYEVEKGYSPIMCSTATNEASLSTLLLLAATLYFVQRRGRRGTRPA